MDDYARAYGYDPMGPWILFVHADGSTEFHQFENEDDMWCCDRDRLEAIKEQQQREIAEARSKGIGPLKLPEFAELTDPALSG